MLFGKPTTALNPEMIAEVLDVMTDRTGEGKTMIGVTHAIGFAQCEVNRVIFMDAGPIVEEAESRTFFTAPRHART